MIKTNLLFSSVIENDGRISKQFTFLGSVLAIAAGAAIITLGFLAVGYLSAVFS